MPAGSIVVDLLLKTGSFEIDAKRAEKRLREFEKAAAEAGRTVGLAFVATATAAAVAFDQFVKGAADFQDLAEVSGASAEGLASLAVAAGTAGTDVAAIADAVTQLAKNLTGVDDESKAAGAALASLNVPIEEFRKLDPIDQIDRLTRAFGAFRDSPEKAALSMALFGKSGTALLPVFKALEQAGGRQTILTQQQIELADAYADRQAEAAATLRLYAQAAATQMLPALEDLTTASRAFVAEVVGIDAATGRLRDGRAMQEFADDAVDALAFAVDAVRGVGQVFNALGTALGAGTATVAAAMRGEVREALAIAREARQGIDDILSAESFRDKLARARIENAANPVLPQVDTRPLLRFEGAQRPRAATADRDDPTRRLLDNRLRELQAAAEREREVFESRNRFLDVFNAQGLLSLRRYFDAQRAAIDEATDAQAASIDRQIEALRRFQQTQPERSERAETEGRINDLVEQRSRLISDAGAKAIELSIRQAEEEQRLAAQIDAVNAQVLELQGNLQAAAAVRFDAQHLELVRRLTAEGNAEALRRVETLRRSTIAQAEFQRASTDAQRVLERLRNSEESIAIARQLGATAELGALQQLGAARAAAMRELESTVAAQEAIARASGNPALAENAERARIELEKLRAAADPVADTFRSIFESGLGDAFADFITGAQSASDAFRGFADAVLRDIARLVAQDFARRLFGSGGGLGDLGGAVARAFGFDDGGYTGNAGEREVAGVVHGGEYVFSAPAVRRIGVPVLERLHEGARRGEAALAGYAAGGLVGAPRARHAPTRANLPAFGQAAADGTAAGRSGAAAAATAPTGQRVLQQTNNFYVNGAVDRRSQEQIAAAVFRAAAVANRRNN